MQKPLVRPTIRIKRYPWVCIACDEMTGESTALSPPEAALLSLCRGLLSVEDLVRGIAQVYRCERKSADDLVRKTLDKCAKHLSRTDFPEVAAEMRLNPLEYIYNADDSQKLPDGALPEPYQAVLLLTERCNFQCSYCFRGGGRLKNSELSTSEWLQIIAELGSMEIVRCIVTGGEPTLHSGCAEIIEHLVTSGIFPFLATNGSRLEGGIIKKLAGAGLKMIQVSLDTVDRDVFYRMTKVNCLQVVQAGIHDAIQAGMMVQVKVVVTTLNSNRIGGLLDYCANEGVSWVNMDPYAPSSMGGCEDTLLCSKEQLLELTETVALKQAQYRGRMFISPFSRIPRWQNRTDIIPCGAFLGTVTVDSCGNIICCDQYDDARLRPGSMRKQPLRDIWNSRQMARIRSLQGIRVDPTCRECEHLGWCRTGCYSISKLYSGDPFRPDPRCWKATTRGPDAVFWDPPRELDKEGSMIKEPEEKQIRAELLSRIQTWE